MRHRPPVISLRCATTRRAVAAAIAVILVAPLSSSAATKPAFGTTTVFATVPAPGHPYGVLATKDSVYVATGAGRPFHPNTGPEAVFKYRRSGGEPIATLPIPTMPTMGLHGMAEDGYGRLYVVDMNSRILRFSPGSATPEVYAMVPEPYMTLGWPASMWHDLAFDRNGNLYVTDASLGGIWRIPPNGMPEVWFKSVEFASMPISGINGIGVGPDGMLYVMLLASSAPDRLGKSALFRLPITAASPGPDQLDRVYEFEHAMTSDARSLPMAGASDLVIGRSGRVYITLTGSNELGVVNLADRTAKRISSPLFDVPIGIRFLGDSLLLANSNFYDEKPEHWQVLKVYVGEPAHPPYRPRIR
ncbi:MAG TPA: hypothetical protein VNA12_01405 [Mycobacteriales bacterium]|nr:hypothetical protein [Mycobacteriales bacterium]